MNIDKLIQIPKASIMKWNEYIHQSKPVNITVNVGNELKHAVIEYPEFLPVTRNGQYIGIAMIKPDGTADINIVNQQELSKIAHILELGVAGKIISKKENLITHLLPIEFTIHYKESRKVTHSYQHLEMPEVEDEME